MENVVNISSELLNTPILLHRYLVAPMEYPH